MNGKPLLPTLRTKKRYVVYKVLSKAIIDKRDILQAIKSSYKECFGTFGLAEAGIMDTRLFQKNQGILKINHKYLDNLRTAMAMIKQINNNKVIIQTITVSGILKKAKSKLGG